MNVTITVKFQTDDANVVQSVENLLNNTLPYMADNVEVDVQKNEPEESDEEILLDAFDRARYLALGGSVTAENELQVIMFDLRHFYGWTNEDMLKRPVTQKEN